jgi:SPP1 family predicted phage head-tail adaptor
MGKVNAGSLNRRITIQRRKAGTNAFNQPSLEWEDYVRVYANLKTQSGSGYMNNEFIAGGAEVNRTAFSFMIRFRKDITADMRVVYEGNVYEIRGILPDLERKEFMYLALAQGASEA